MEEHLTILPPPPPIWMTLRAATTAIVGRAAAAIVRVVTSMVHLARRRAGPEATLSAILDRIDGERGCLPIVAPIGGALAGAARRSERPTRPVQLRRDVGHRGERTAIVPRFRHNEALGALLDQLGAPELSPVELDALSAELDGRRARPEASLDLHQAVGRDRPEAAVSKSMAGS